MKIKYHCITYMTHNPITLVECKKETESSVWIVRKGRLVQYKKETKHEAYFDTFQEALDFYVRRCNAIIVEANKAVINAQNHAKETKKIYEERIEKICAIITQETVESLGIQL